VTVQVSQIISPESTLLQDFHGLNQADNSFQKYLDEEQKRLTLLLSPFGQFNFSSWFQYPDFTLKTDSSGGKVNFFSDVELPAKKNNHSNPESGKVNDQNQSPLPHQTASQTGGQFYIKPSQTVLQDLLLKTGWLVPNLESQPLLLKAQQEGTLLNKLDLQSLVDEIISQLKLVKEKGSTQLSLGLKPEDMGEILLTLTSKSGLVSIQIEAPERTKKLLEAKLEDLKLALKKSSVNLSEIKIVGLKEVGKHV
jgi:flagellar hook-length control protein FliK